MRIRENHNLESGQLLLEVLIVVAVASVVIAVTSQMIYVSMRSNKTAGDRNVALGLVEEALEGVRSAAEERWPDLFDVEKGQTAYYPQKSGGKWVITSGSENVTINGISYVRSVTIQNVCRDASSREITGITDSSGSAIVCTESGGTHDPSSQQVSAVVSWTGGAPVNSQELLTRWRNKVCVQTGWSGTGSGPNVCPATVYESKTNINTTTGTSIELCNGC